MKDIKQLNPLEILRTPLLNKGTAFTFEERSLLGLHGLLPFHVSTIEQQVERRYQNFLQATPSLNKYLFLKNLQDRNEILFYRLGLKYPEELLPYIYTPTVGDASLDYSNIYSEIRGVYISYELRDHIDEILSNLPYQNIDVIVVTDGSRILGLGDVGIGGMTIPIGKLSLYTLFGGIHPAKTLPVILDVGTDNQQLLNDPLYLGARHPRITGQEYDDFVDLFVSAIKKKFPKILLQWEDFSKNHARVLLDRYRDKLCSFNDDIQGTAAVALAAILGALKGKNEKLVDQKIAILGGGSAGLGIAEYIASGMKEGGLSDEKIYSKFFIVDINGLIHSKMDIKDSNQKKFSQNHEKINLWKVKNPKMISLEDVIVNAKPTILLGVSTQPKVFTQSIIETMAANCKRPIIFPLSNPTSKEEADPKDIIMWSKGEAIVATGSPSKSVDYQGRKIPIAQCNNVYIFPGVGLGIIASKAKYVPHEMFIKAANILSDYAPILKDPQGSIFPEIKDLRKIAKHIGIEIAKYAFEHNLAQVEKKDIENLIDETMWFPDYPTYKK